VEEDVELDDPPPVAEPDDEEDVVELPLSPHATSAAEETASAARRERCRRIGKRLTALLVVRERHPWTTREAIGQVA